MFTRIVIVGGALLIFLAAGLRTWAAAYLRTEVVHDTAQHSEALVADGPFRYTRNPLYLAFLPMVAGIGVLASRSGFIFLVLANWIFFHRLIFREEESLLKTQGGIVSGVLRSGPAFLACAKAARSVRKSTTRLGPGFRGRELCLVVRCRRIVDRSDPKHLDRCFRVFARVRRTFSNRATDPKTAKRVTGVVGRLLAGVTAFLSYKMQRVTTLAVVTLA